MTGDEFAGIKIGAIAFARFIDGKQRGMLHIRIRAGVGQKFLGSDRIAAQIAAQHIERDQSTDRSLLGFINFGPEIFR